MDPRRKKELEEKKKKLEEYKKTRLQKQSEGAKQDSPLSPDTSEKKDTLESYLASLDKVLPPKSPDLATHEQIQSSGSASSNGSSDLKTDELNRSSSSSGEGTRRRRKVNLVKQTNVVAVEITPRETAVYSKGTQTSTEAIGSDAVRDDEKSQEKSESDNKENKEENINANQGGETANASTEQVIDKEAIISSATFQDFITKSSRLVERALFVDRKYDITVNYAESDADGDKFDSKGKIALQTKLFDERWSNHRSITDLGWSSKHPDLLIASYSASESGSNDPDGVVLVWSAQNTLQRPEYRFHCQSPVMTCFFSKFSPTLIVGGTYSGQIVLWDIRARSNPMQHTPLSSIGHTHPVYAMEIVGTKNAHSLVTVSTDGKLCVWSLENLLQPQEVLELHSKQSRPVSAAAPVAVTSMAFKEGEVNGFFVGSEEGAVYSASRHGSQRGVSERFEGHFGPVTGIDFHPPTGSVDFSDLFLTGSTDWTVKLWNQKSSTKPIYSFDNAAGDYIYDVKWCPTHPALFATADGTGNLDFWNVNEETEIAILKTKVTEHALNKIQWSSDGKRILTGDSSGALYIYDSSEVSTPRLDEWQRLEDTLVKLSMQEEETKTS